MKTETPTKERPILFSGPMVRALLEGRKTQTRRIVKPQPVDVDNFDGAALLIFSDDSDAPSFHIGPKPAGFPCPYGMPGDRLWVKETHLPKASGVLYRADLDPIEGAGIGAMYGGWKPSIFCRREYSRITLEIESVWVERLQEINWFDASAEGVRPEDLTDEEFGTAPDFNIDYVSGYRRLWESINGPGSWDANPWVWVVTFKLAQP